MGDITKTVNISSADIVSGRLPTTEILNRLHDGEHMLFISSSPDETYFLGRMLGERCVQGEVYTLTGNLGVGKTLFTQGFAVGLDITETVSSPTFTILQMYDTGRLPFYHFDVYRIGDVEEMEEVGWEDCIYGGGVCIVEWAELIQEILPSKRFQILIEKDSTQGFNYRRIMVYYEDTGA